MTACVVNMTASLISGLSSLSDRRVGDVGHRSGGSHKNSGPCNHLDSIRLDTGTPLDASSAGLSRVGTCRHSSAFVVSRISATLFATKVWYLASVLSMYCNTMVLSVQKVEGPRFKSNSFRNNAFCLAANVAAYNSSRGMVSLLMGVSLALAITMVHSMWPSVVTTRRYDMTP